MTHIFVTIFVLQVFIQLQFLSSTSTVCKIKKKTVLTHSFSRVKAIKSVPNEKEHNFESRTIMPFDACQYRRK